MKGRIDHVRRVIVTGSSRGEEVVHTVYTMVLPSKMEVDGDIYGAIDHLKGTLEAEGIEEVKITTFGIMENLRLRKMTEYVKRNREGRRGIATETGKCKNHC